MRRQSRAEVCLFTAGYPGTLLWGLRAPGPQRCRGIILEKMPPSGLHKVFAP